MKFIFTITVRKKNGICDPESDTIKNSLIGYGFDNVVDLKMDKVFNITIESDNIDDAKKIADDIVKNILSNPIIEEYVLEEL